MILGKLQWREREEEASGEGLPRVKGESLLTTSQSVSLLKEYYSRTALRS